MDTSEMTGRPFHEKKSGGEASPSLQDLFAKFGDRLPTLNDELSKRLNLPDTATLDQIQANFDQRSALYRQRSAGSMPVPVRMKNQALLRQLESLSAEFDRYKGNRELWEHLAEAAVNLEAGILPRARLRLRQAERLIRADSEKKLVKWHEDLIADLEIEGRDGIQPPRVHCPESASGCVGAPFSLAFKAEPPDAVIEVGGLPRGLVRSPDGNSLRGVPEEAGEFAVTLKALSLGLEGSAALRLTIAKAEPVIVIAPLEETGKVEVSASDSLSHGTIQLASGRRLHLLCGANARLGRLDHKDSILLHCVCKRNKALTVMLNAQISREHCEFRILGSRVRVFDGWTDTSSYSLRPSKSGVFVDNVRVGIVGEPLADGQIVRVTSRDAGPETPHWKVHLLKASPEAPRSGSSSNRLKTGNSISLFLERLDDIKEDILLLQAPSNLEPLGLSTEPCWIDASAGSLVVGADSVEKIGDRLPGAVLVARNRFLPFSFKELLG